MLTCVCVHPRMCIHMCMRECAHVSMYVTCVGECVCSVGVCACTHTCVCMCVLHAWVDVCMCVAFGGRV